MASLRALVLALAVASAAGRLLAPKQTPAAKVVPAKEAAKKEAPAKEAAKTETAPKVAKTSAKPAAAKAPAAKPAAAKPAPATAKNATKNAPLTEEEQVQRLKQSLTSIQKLRSTFTEAKLDQDKSGIADMASGALTSELGKQDSSVWSTIQNMLEATAKVTADLKGKSKADKEKLMAKLEDTLNAKSDDLRAVTDRTTKVQEQHSAEYLLGLLNQHKQWTLEQQLNATRTFAKSSDAAAKLLKTYNKTKALAPQLAVIMDEEAKAAAPAKATAKAAKKAALMFIQLVDEVVPMKAATNPAAKAENATQAEKAVSEEEQLKRLQNGLVSIRKLKTTFQGQGKANDLEQFAAGALTSELGKSDSSVWSTIETMLDATAKVTASMKGKSKAEKDKLMTSLSDTLNKKAQNLQTAAETASKVNQEHSNEYLLGLLMQHTEWSEQQQLNATKKFAGDSSIIKELLSHHDETKPLAPQLAALMDKEKPGASKAAKDSAVVKQLTKEAPKLALKAKIEKPVEKKMAKPETPKAKVEKKAKMMLLQLVSSLREEVAAF